MILLYVQKLMKVEIVADNWHKIKHDKLKLDSIIRLMICSQTPLHESWSSRLIKRQTYSFPLACNPQIGKNIIEYLNLDSNLYHLNYEHWIYTSHYTHACISFHKAMRQRLMLIPNNMSIYLMRWVMLTYTLKIYVKVLLEKEKKKAYVKESKSKNFTPKKIIF